LIKRQLNLIDDNLKKIKAVTNTDANYFPILNENYPKNRNGFYDVRQ
jgi:hypothetical protein